MQPDANLPVALLFLIIFSILCIVTLSSVSKDNAFRPQTLIATTATDRVHIFFRDAAMNNYFQNIITAVYSAQVEKVLAEGRVPLAYTCSYIPNVMLSADNLFPFRLRAQEVAGTEIADIYLSNMGCTYLRSILEMTMDDRYHFIGGWILAASCNQMHRLYDNLIHLVKPNFIHILDVPHKTGDAAVKWYTDELRILRRKIQDYFDVDMGDEVLTGIIHAYNSLQARLRKIGELRQQPDPPLSGAQFHELITAAASLPVDLIEPRIAGFTNTLKEKSFAAAYRARVMLVGGQLDNPEFIRVIETAGALVVADHMCTGNIFGMDLVLTGNDPIPDIAAHYLGKMNCPRMMTGFDQRLESILQKAEQYHVDGIIFEYIKFCDIWGMEGRLLIHQLKKADKYPLLLLEREYTLTGEGQLRTRVQAFLESMGK